MSFKLLFCGIIILISSCREGEIKFPQVDRCFESFPQDSNLEKNSWTQTQAKESYTVRTSDSWTYATTMVFEKYNDLDYRLRTKRFNRDSLMTQRQISKQDWDYVCSSIDSLNFWCTEYNEPIYSTDGHEITILGKVDSHFHQAHIGDYSSYERTKYLSDSKRGVVKTALQFLRFGGYEGLKKPRFVIRPKSFLDTIRVESYFMDPFVESSEMFINQVRVDSREGIHLLKIPKSKLGKAHLIAKAVLVNGETCIYEVDLNDYFINKIKENRQYE